MYSTPLNYVKLIPVKLMRFIVDYYNREVRVNCRRKKKSIHIPV